MPGQRPPRMAYPPAPSRATFDIGGRSATAQLTPPGPTPNVQFGSRVTIVGSDGRRQAYRIVGIDEADPTKGRLSYLSPLAQAMINCEVGDTIDVGATQAEIIEIA